MRLSTDKLILGWDYILLFDWWFELQCSKLVGRGIGGMALAALKPFIV